MNTDIAETKKEIYTYDAGFRIYAMNWSVRPDRPFRMAMASFSENQDNKVRVVQLNDDKGVFDVLSEVAHPYPATNLKWIPDKLGSRTDMFATTADYLRLWQVSDDGKTTLRSTLQNVRHQPAQTHHRRLYARHTPLSLLFLLQFDSNPPLSSIQNKSSEYCAPLTSFDWNENNPELIGTSSIDTTCTIWNINVRTHIMPKTN